MGKGRHRETAGAIVRRIVAVTLLGGGVGVVSTIAATGFVAVVVGSERWLIAPLAYDRGIEGALLLMLVLTGGGLLVGLIRWWGRPARMQGPANAIAAAQGLERLLPAAAGFRSTVCALVSIVSGASVGQYGPLAHLGALLGFGAARLAGADAPRRSIAIACGAAAAISTAFNAPIAGVVFAHEVVLRHFSLRAFAPVTVASIIGYLFTHFIAAHDALFELAHPVYVFAPEYAVFAAIGVAGGLIAVTYMRAIFACERLADASRVPVVLRPALAGFVVAVIALEVPEVLGVGQVPLGRALDGAFSVGELSVLLGAKFAATALCLGLGFVGGVFSPSLLIGVVFGALCGTTLETLFPMEHSDIVIYAACGMVAVVSPVIGGPLTAILIIFELTGSYEIATAAMLSAVMSNLVSYRVFGRSFFDEQLAREGYDLSMGREKLVLSETTVEPLVDRAAARVLAAMTVPQSRRAMLAVGASEAAVVDDGGRLLGIVRLADVLGADADTPVSTVAREGVVSLEPRTPVWQAMEYVNHSAADHFPIVDDAGVFLGMVSHRDIVAAYLDVSRSVRREQSDLS